jgi:DNA-binding NarL/FixJ family response regulator
MGESTNTEDRRPVRLMLADNHAMFRQSVASMLSKDGEVEVVGDADNGPQATDLAKERRPDVIVMQVEPRPEEAGTEIRGMLKASPASRVVVLTVHQDPRMVRRMVGLGTSAYVHKSATVEELGVVRRAAQGPQDGESDYAVVGMPERMMGQVRKADDHGISARELEVLVLAGRGLSNAQIASRLHLSEATVKRHLGNAYPKMGVSSRGEAVSRALSEGGSHRRTSSGQKRDEPRSFSGGRG